VLPSQWSLLQIDHPGVVASALRLGEEGGAVLRIYEATGVPVEGIRVKLSVPVTAAEEVNLMEDPIRALPVTNNGIVLDLRGFEIKTVRFELGVLEES
jgi:alpha-mannosidase